jgi:hypothetical protein
LAVVVVKNKLLLLMMQDYRFIFFQQELSASNQQSRGALFAILFQARSLCQALREGRLRCRIEKGLQ